MTVILNTPIKENKPWTITEPCGCKSCQTHEIDGIKYHIANPDIWIDADTLERTLPETLPEPLKSSRIARNSPCDCGSGRKAKKCCHR